MRLLLGGPLPTGLDILFAQLQLAAQVTTFILVFIGEARSLILIKSFWEKGTNTATSLFQIKTNFHKAYIKKLVKEAYANSLAKVKDKKQIMNGQTIVKSISAKKREKKQGL